MGSFLDQISKIGVDGQSTAIDKMSSPGIAHDGYSVAFVGALDLFGTSRFWV